jgi:hypothetical protein
MIDYDTRESRLRSMATRQGLAIQKSRSRNPDAPSFGLYRIVDPYQNWVVAGADPWDYSLDLDDVEEFLTQ